MRLGTLLLRDAIISLNQLEEALRAQVLYGDRLGTNLVELGSLDLDTLGLYLSKVHGVPVATVAHMEAADPALTARLGAEAAARACAFPLGEDPARPGAIAVAMADPRDPDRVADLTRRTGCSITPWVAAELRISAYLEQRLGIPRRPRLARQTDRGIAPSAAAARVTTIEAVGSIATAHHRDPVADQLIGVARGRAGAAALFLVRGRTAIGWRGLGTDGRALAGAAIEGLTLSLADPSVLKVAFDTQRPHRGPGATGPRSAERQIWLALGVADPPTDMLVVPIVVARRVVNLFYAHGPSGGAIAERHARELIEVAQAAASAYVRLIRTARADRPA
ncbi:MAG TPA: hypothetical protein VK698_00225 [Kofleriaceae bacterium]|nr:hypothetical protein [Kofleriaceae bacterium]